MPSYKARMHERVNRTKNNSAYFVSGQIMNCICLYILNFKEIVILNYTFTCFICIYNNETSSGNINMGTVIRFNE